VSSKPRYQDIKVRCRYARYLERDSTASPPFKDNIVLHAQTPTLFDFAKAKLQDVIIQ
jgi:hypothetical protein